MIQNFYTFTIFSPENHRKSKFPSDFTLPVITHTLASCYAGTAVAQGGGEERAKQCEALLHLVPAPQLDAE